MSQLSKIIYVNIRYSLDTTNVVPVNFLINTAAS